MLSLVALMLVALVGGAGAYWAYKKYKDHTRQQGLEYQVEGSLAGTTDGFDPEVFKKQMLADIVLDAVVKKHELVSVWGVADASAAKAQLRQKFAVYIKDGKVTMRYQDKDKQLAESVLMTMFEIYREKYAPASQPAPGF